MDKKISNWLHAWDSPQGFVLFKKEKPLFLVPWILLMAVKVLNGSLLFQSPLLEQGHTDTKILKLF